MLPSRSSIADCCGCGRRGTRRFHQGTSGCVSPFTLSLNDLAALHNGPGSAGSTDWRSPLQALGGLSGVCRALSTDSELGIAAGTQEELELRRRAFGENCLPEPPFRSWWSFLIEVFKERIIIILSLASIVSLILGSVENPHHGGFIDGLAILMAVVVIACVTASNNYHRQLQFRQLSSESSARVEVQVVRSGRRCLIRTGDLVVGDLVHLETGAKVPADGLIVRSSDLKSNESSMTGESNDIHKDAQSAPLLISGTHVVAGTCDYLVTAVGVHSLQGTLMTDVSQETETPLQKKLAKLASRIGSIGTTFALCTFFALIAVKGLGGETTDSSWGAYVMNSFIYTLTIIVVAIPEGLPLAVTISLAYSTRKMLADQNLIRYLAACETMGEATDLCLDKTGTLTENRMIVAQAWLGGVQAEFSASQDRVVGASEGSASTSRIPRPLLALLSQHLALNSTAHVITSEKGVRSVVGSKTEGAGVLLAESLGCDVDAVRKARRRDVEKQYAFHSDRKMMATLVHLPASEGGGLRLFVTGGSDTVLSRCCSALVVQGAETGSTLSQLQLAAEQLEELHTRVIAEYAAKSLRTLAVAFRDFSSLEVLPADFQTNAPDDLLTLYAILGLKDPLRPDAAAAVAACRGAGVTVRMLTGDNAQTATAIARECGILNSGGIVMEGPDFRELSPSQLDRLLPRLSILARSTPRDKNILVRRLNGNLPRGREEWEQEHAGRSWDAERDRILPGYREEWEQARSAFGAVYQAVVAVTGDGTNDAPALKAADVGLSMGLSGTQVAVEASDVIILDDRFSSIVKAVLWGRAVYDNVQKFLQFQLTVNIVALWITLLAAVMQMPPPLNPVMMLWVNLLMDSFGALALGTEAPSVSLLHRKPYFSSASLITPMMWRQILVGSFFQLSVMLCLLQMARDVLGISPSFLASNGKWLKVAGKTQPDESDVAVYTSTFIFNAFVFTQIINEFNSRSLDNNWKVFSGLAKNRLFLLVILASILGQTVIVELGGIFTKTSGLTGKHWVLSILIATASIPLGILQRFLPVYQRQTDFAELYQHAFYRSLAQSGDCD